LKKILKLLNVPRLNKALAQNVCICIGRLALINPEVVSQYLSSFIKQFCLTLKSVTDSEEKREAFKGIIQTILINPAGVLNHFAFFCDAVCQYDDANEEMQYIFKNIMYSYKRNLAENWEPVFNTFPDKLKRKLSHRFHM